jgi:HEAT repeat protein
MSLYPELNHLTLKELIEYFQGQPLEREDASTYYLEVALLIKNQGDAGVDYLYKAIDAAEPDRLRGIIFALSESPVDKDKLRPLLINYLHHQQPMIVAEVIDGLRKLGEKDAVEQVLAMLEHSSPYVRGSVLRFVARLYPDKALPLLLDKLKDSHFIVRENAADELGDLGIVSAIPYLRAILLDAHPDVRQAAQTAIQMLSHTEQ